MTLYIVSKAHLLAFKSEAAANQRYLVAGGAYTFQLVANIIRERFSELRNVTPQGNPTSPPVPDTYKVDTSKITKDLGLSFRPIEETFVDNVKSLRTLAKKLE